MKGKVWLVGAGPGDAELITLKGRRVLSEADVVVYDALVADGILSMIPDNAKVIFAGKRSGHHFLKQDETNRILLEEALKGNNVVRLKGGDPFLFGRGGEELELLRENDVPFEVVPGITSALSVPAYNGIPVTHRDYCSSVHIITGHRRQNAEYDINFKALVEHKGTLIFLMGLAALGDICKGLLEAGMDPDMPAAVLEKGTTAAQKKYVATLGTIEAEAANANTPAIIVVGKVCDLAGEFSWYEKRPLAGVKVVVTRPKELVSEFSKMLRSRGAEVIEMPSIAISPISDNEKLDRAIKGIDEYDWVVFTSPSGVRVFFERLFETSDVRSLGNVRIASIGKGSGKELLKYGIRPDFVPSVYDGATLGKELSKIIDEGSKILIPRAAIGNKELVLELQNTPNVTIDDIATYDTVYETDDKIDISSELISGEIDYAVFTSASTVVGFVNGIGDMDFTKVKAICIGKQTQSKALEYGMQTFVSKSATLESLCECLEEKVKGC